MASNHSIRKIGYARISTSDQSLDMQIDALKRYGVSESLIFTDKMSGASNQRPGFIRALKTAQHAGSEFVVWKLDRLGRTLTGILQTIELLREREIIFVSLTERIDTGSSMGKAMFHLLAVFAELERDMIRERTLAGMKRAKERGDKHGRKIVMTETRIARARELLGAGRRGNDVWKELRKMEGPPISRAAYYVWQRQYDIENKKLST